MKNKFFLFLLGLVVSFGMISCQDTNAPEDNPENPSSGLIERKITTYVLGEDVQKTSPYIRALTECEDWVIMDIVHDGFTYDDSRSFVLMSQTQQEGYYIYATPEMVILSQFTDNIDDDLLHGNVMFMSVEGDYTRYAVVNSLLENPTIVSQTMIKSVEETPLNARRVKARDSFGASIYRTISRCFRDGSEEISDKLGWTSWLPGRAGNLASIWSSSIFAISLKQITDYNPDIEEEAYDEVVENHRFFLKQTILSMDFVNMASYAYNFVTKHTIIGKLWNDNHKIEETTSDGESEHWYPMYSTSRMVDQQRNGPVQVVWESKQDYAITLTCDNVTETSATFHIRIEDLVGTMGFISSMKLHLESVTGETQDVDFYDLSPTITVPDLKPLTGYTAQVKIHAKGTPCTSTTVPFITKGQLELNPTELSFPLISRSKAVSLSNIHKKILKSFTVSAPSWCEIEQETTSFWVKVSESKVKRTGTITVNVILTDDTKLTGTVSVIQEEVQLGWDNTKWKFSGNVTTSGFGESATNYGEFYLTVNSVENNDFSWVFGSLDIGKKISVNEAGQLYVTGEVSMDGSTNGWSMTATRTSAKGATCSFQGGNEYVSQHGTFNGVLIE